MFNRRSEELNEEHVKSRYTTQELETANKDKAKLQDLLEKEKERSFERMFF